MDLSYWEIKHWLKGVDYTVVGSGITGLNCALKLRENNPHAHILVLEKGVLPQGASTKNAGFACFGSLSELLDDLKNQPEEAVVSLVKKRIEGLEVLKKRVGTRAMDFRMYGGHEVFPEEDEAFFEECHSRMHSVNQLLRPLLGETVFTVKPNTFKLAKVHPYYISNSLEGQIDTGKMMRELLYKASTARIPVLNATRVKAFSDNVGGVHIETDHFTFKTRKLCIATNGFASHLGIAKVAPARAQVLITKPVKKLPIQGTFHMDRGFYYFRDIDGCVLLGGGRNLDMDTENTDVFGQTPLIQNKLKELLSRVILPDTPFEIAQQWSGIMGVGSEKTPIVKQLSEHVFCGVRLGGMGVAIGSLVGEELATLAMQ
ncbi:FAD-dependent oxidoreductase [Ascidiimonas aurantiaca]|uniref:NAD(P)/FAD-dependent oxidoreductase n=1 Tax=Ascidiimonas aurantiaca TaxID=1685432 RepID=UPI0030EEAA5C